MKEKIEIIELPISTEGENPRQLELWKNGECIACYDPVTEIFTFEDRIIIFGFLGNKYEHSFQEFDEIKAVPWSK